MIKKVMIGQLQVGMYVHDLNCGWMDHGFLRTHFLIESDESLQKIHDTGVQELYIDTERGLDALHAPTEQEVATALEHDLAQLAAEKGPNEEQATSLAEERIQAGRIHKDAIAILSTLSDNIRRKHPVNLDDLEPLAEDVLASILRNRDALIGYSRTGRLERYQFEHGINVCVFSVALAQTLGFERRTLLDIAIGGLLHDIGKSFLPTSILEKPGQLTAAEIETMRRHVADGFIAASDIPGIPPIALAMIAEHHERMDGSGYPQRRTGDKITRYGQMAAIVDVYDAITSDRVYNAGLEPHAALRKMLEWSSYHFNAELVHQFIRSLGIYPIGTLVRLQSERLGVVVESDRNSLFHPVVRVVMDTKHRQYLRIEDVDLAKAAKKGTDRIIGAELPKRWGIDSVEVLQLPSK